MSDLPAPEPPVLPDLADFWVRGGAYILDVIVLMLSAFLPGHGLGLLVAIAYRTIFISQGGQTPGKMAAGVRVVCLDGSPVGIGRALARSLSEYLSAFTLCVGYLPAAFSDKRALHDYIAGTRVVYEPGVGSGRKLAFGLFGGLVFIGSIGGGIAMGIAGVGGFSKFKDLQSRAGEGMTKSSLGMLRSGLAIYYGDAEGNYPATLDALIPKHVKEIPPTSLPDHSKNAAWAAYGGELCTGSTNYGETIDRTKLKDTGGWGYVTDPKSKCWGEVFVNCTHMDSKGSTWAGY